MELINARVKNGSILPIGQPILVKSFSEIYKKGFYHSLAKRYVFIKENNGSLVAYDEGFKNPQSFSNTIVNVTSVEFVGVTFCAITDNGIYYFIFKNGSYNYIGSKPDFNISVWADEEKELSYKETFWYEKTKGASPERIDYRDVPSFLDFLDSCKNKALDPYKNEGRFTDPVCVRAALRTYSGEYISHSPITLLFPKKKMSSAGYLDDIAREWVGDKSETGDTTKFGVEISKTLSTYKVKFEYTFDDIITWGDIVVALDIFISRPINIIDAETSNTEGIYIGSEIPLIRVYSRDSIGTKIINSPLYLSSTVTGNTGSGYLKSAEVTNSRLIDDQFSRNSISGKATFVYNGRLHIGNIRSLLFEGFGSKLLLNPSYESYNGYLVNSLLAHIKTYTYINTDSGEKIVRYEGNALNPLGAFYNYPDRRASKAVIYASLADGSYKKTTLSLSKGELNVGYYLGWDHEYNRVTPIYLNKGTSISKSEYDNPGLIVDNMEESPNKIKVSGLNNPFSFPAEQTYIVSSGEIAGIAAATSALSAGQFGQFPIYIFCSDGIYALSVGSGSIAYSSSSPLSRDVCVNPKSITSIDSAIVFATEAGIMLLSGSSVQKLSDKIEGYLPSSFNSSPVLDKILNIPKLQGSIVEFRDYIENASIGYIYEEKEIIVSNKQYSYSYVYNLYSREWSKLSVSVNSFLNSYPKTLAVFTEKSGCGIYNLHNPHRTINNIAIISRPVKFGSLTHKRILQSALRGIIKPSLSDVYFRGEPVQFREENVQIFSEAGFYILGSNDAEHFSLLAGTEKLNDIRDLITKMNKTKAYKYFMFCLVGGVRTDVAINYIEVMADEAFDNRLR